MDSEKFIKFGGSKYKVDSINKTPSNVFVTLQPKRYQSQGYKFALSLSDYMRLLSGKQINIPFRGSNVALELDYSPSKSQTQVRRASKKPEEKVYFQNPYKKPEVSLPEINNDLKYMEVVVFDNIGVDKKTIFVVRDIGGGKYSLGFGDGSNLNVNEKSLESLKNHKGVIATDNKGRKYKVLPKG